MTSAREAQVDSRNILHRLQDVLASRSKSNAIADFVGTQTSTYYNWVGVFLVKGETVVLAAYAGDAETEHVTVPIGQAICGSAAKSGETILVPDVSKDPGYLVCIPSTRSEIVVPVVGRNGVIGGIDIESDRVAAFNPADKHHRRGHASSTRTSTPACRSATATRASSNTGNAIELYVLRPPSTTPTTSASDASWRTCPAHRARPRHQSPPA